MTAFQTVGPAAEPVTLVEAKAHLRVAHDSEDALIEGLIRAAREEVERSTGVALMEQDWRVVLDRLPQGGVVELAPYPVREIIAVTMFGRDGEGEVLAPSAYRLRGLGRPARLEFGAVPSAGEAANGIEIDYRAGFGEAGTEVPDLLKRAMLVLVAHWYEFRAAYDGSGQPVSYPAGYDRLIRPYKRMRIG